MQRIEYVDEDVEMRMLQEDFVEVTNSAIRLYHEREFWKLATKMLAFSNGFLMLCILWRMG